MPTILIASVVMLTVLTSALVAASAAVTSLNEQHYSRYARNAAESGLAMARACLAANDYEATWSDAKPLRPNTDCNGDVQPGPASHLHAGSDLRSSFSVTAPEALANGVQRVAAVGSAERLRTSSGQPWRGYTQRNFAVVSAQTSFGTVAFGYAFNRGVFFAVVGADGSVSTVGYNGDGQLGNGSTLNAATPQSFPLPAGVTATQLYASFLSNGYNMLARASDGNVYGAGANGQGQLGNAAVATAQTSPVRFRLPAGVGAAFASAGWTHTFVLGDDHNLYSAGACTEGILGHSYAIPGCSSRSTPQRVALPPVNPTDPNTLPASSSNYAQATNLVNDGFSAFVLMQGGRVYGWGRGDNGQLGNGSDADQATPVQFGTLGNPGQPKGTQIAFDGYTTWVLDDHGDIWSSGMNHFGELGAPTQLRTTTGLCVENPGNATAPGQRIELRTCGAAGSAAQALHFGTDRTIRFRPDASTTLCLDNYGGLSGDGNAIQTYPCNGTASQQWTMRDDGRIVNAGTGKCLDNTNDSSISGSLMQLWFCDVNSPAQVWNLPVVSATPTKVFLPPGGKATRLSTDQFSLLVLMEDGTVWGVGANGNGVLGNGGSYRFNPGFQRFQLPAGRTAVDLYAANDAPSGIGNTYVVLDDGSVWGSGSNGHGQLGNGTTGAVVPTPVQMNLPAGVRAKGVQAGYGTAVVLTEQGRIYTVGNNGQGQLGDGTTTSSAIPSARPYLNVRPVLFY